MACILIELHTTTRSYEVKQPVAIININYIEEK